MAKRSWRAGFWSLIATQFQGAFSDNAFKILVMFLVIGGEAAQGLERVLLVGALFAVPFLLFSMAGGYLADRFSKRTVTIGTKVMEVGVMTLGLAGLASGSLALKVAAVFLMSVQSALFSPSKYGLLPELVPHRRLSWGNGILELMTFLAIILGTVAGGILAQAFRGRHYYSGLIFVGLALVGLLTSLGVSRVPAADPARSFRLNFLGDLFGQFGLIRRDRALLMAVLGNTYFWFLAALLQFNIFFYGLQVLRGTETENSLLMAAVAIGIGVGSWAAGHLSGGKIEIGLIPLGSVGMTVLGAALYRGGLSFTEVAVLLGLLGFFSGFFVVPVNAVIQQRPDPAQKGGVIAANNVLSFLGIFLSSAVYYLLAGTLHLSPPVIFLVSALMTVAATLYLLFLLPDALLRLLLWMGTHLVYRIRVEGRRSVPEHGGALFVSNHLSFVDALLLIASTDRFVRFLMYKGYYQHPLIRPLARIMRVIPISSELRPREMIHSLREATRAIQHGEIVCIFAEGQITRIGHLLPFRRGLERIMKGVEAPIIPVHLAGVWGSIFSFEKRRFLWKLPRAFPYPVTISFGPPLPPSSSAFQVREAVQDLETRAWHFRREQMRRLEQGFLRSARRHPFRFAMADAGHPRLRAGPALLRTVLLAGRLRRLLGEEEKVGLLLPPSVDAALANLALLLMGKVPVNLNYTTSAESLASATRQCRIQTVLTSRAFLERVSLTVPARVLLLEDLGTRPGAGERLRCLLKAFLLPAGRLERGLACGSGKSLDDLATVIFSSGSTGEPKGVMLSHYNIASNIEQLAQVFFLNRRDRVLGVLPFFHSFGFTGTLMLPAVLGVGVVYHPNPLDARSIGRLVSRYGVTFLLATPTFLQTYTRRCPPGDFGSLELVLAGAEKLPRRVADAFEDTFGIRPVEGYGATECSPVISVNGPDYRAAGFRQVGARRGTIGHPLPGVRVRVVDPETGEPLPAGESGLLLVQGPNVMRGYLDHPQETARAFRDGWYVTGDIARLDEDGFLTITDRLSRFAKIGGEMVPHVKIEETLLDLAAADEQVFAVTSVPDERKGERLVVLHTLPEEKLDACLEKLESAGLPRLWLPRPDHFFRVEALPCLGTGKLDLRRIRQLALELTGG